MKVSAAAARAIADVSAGMVLATVDIAAPPERVFRALSDPIELVKWWGSADTYRVEAMTADLRVGGKWQSKGRGADGHPFTVEGEYLEVDPPRKLVLTWNYDWDRARSTTLTYLLEPTNGGTRLTVRHTGFGDDQEGCRGHGAGWEQVLGWLQAYHHERRL